MTFDKVLPALMAGKRAFRPMWPGRDNGDWLELVSGEAGDRRIGAALMIWKAVDRSFWTWGGVQKDILADDWEVVE